MSADLDNSTVADIAAPIKNALVGGPFGSNLVSKDYTESGVPVIRGQNMGYGRWVAGEFAFVSPQKANDLSANTARPGDLIFTQRGTLGQVAIVPHGPYEKYIVSQSQMKLTVDQDKADTQFLYYLFCSPKQQAYIQTNAIQVGVPHTNLGILRDTPISLPPLEDQREIALILSKLDDKIELNRQINQTLEEMAQAIFKSWFVDFEPVKAKTRAKANGQDPERAAMGAISGKSDAELDQLPPDQLAQLQATAALFPDELTDSELGPMPKGWEWKSLDEVANYQNGLALQKYRPEDENDFLPIVKIAQLKAGEATSEEKASPNINPACIIDNGDVVFSWSGSLMVDIWCGGKAALNQHLFKVTSEKYPQWFFYYWTKHHLAKFQQIAADKAVTMGHIKRSHLKETMCAVSDFEVKELIVMANLIDEQIAARLENTTLVQLRDNLLPKLLSGELSLMSESQEDMATYQQGISA